jgi:hypothetical protein
VPHFQPVTVDAVFAIVPGVIVLMVGIVDAPVLPVAVMIVVILHSRNGPGVGERCSKRC